MKDLLQHNGEGRERPRSSEVSATSAVRRFIDALVREEALVLVENADEAALAERLLRFLEEKDAVEAIAELGEWLLEQPELDELFADDRRLESTLRHHLA